MANTYHRLTGTIDEIIAFLNATPAANYVTIINEGTSNRVTLVYYTT